MNFLGWCSALIMLSFNALAVESNKEIASCTLVENELARLSCYDAMAQGYQSNVVPKKVFESQRTGKWTISEKINPIDDTKSVTLKLDTISHQDPWHRRVNFVARCLGNKTEAYIMWRTYLGVENSVLTRIGTEPAMRTQWRQSSDHRATYHTQPISFLKHIAKSNRLVAQITPYNKDPITAIFDTSGLNHALTTLRESCRW
ncbi:hypothetical protein HGP28_09405 [Vibrio sp. SM6]|uniref:Type VI secretion protein VasI n=1 Tax=Vibrio agarilyticus TaxID=2726741 RepID=A0A7X8YGW7_9VIBR|nr:type VI secretion system-associated protein TagO [Vibrio agarilyticus]NLS13104.1 hypothetical protein [Vibrio agarilyticus]